MVSALTLTLLGLTFVLAITTVVFWWRVEATSIDPETVRKWQHPEHASTIEPAMGRGPRLEEAADVLNVAPEDLPERVRTLDEKVRELQGDLTSLRRRWADLWVAMHREAANPEDPVVLVADLADGNLDDGKALAKAASDQEDVVLIAAAQADGAWAVGVGTGLTATVSASVIADQIGNKVDGGGGGSAAVASGGQADQDELRAAIDVVRTDIEADLAGHRVTDTETPNNQ